MAGILYTLYVLTSGYNIGLEPRLLTPLPMSSITKGTLNLARKVSVSHEQRERQRVIAAEDTETKGWVNAQP